jgi:hypothetical protein
MGAEPTAARGRVLSLEDVDRDEALRETIAALLT